MPAPSQFTTLMVHKARADQIRFEAEKRGISAAEMVEALINLGIEHGTFPITCQVSRFILIQWTG